MGEEISQIGLLNKHQQQKNKKQQQKIQIVVPIQDRNTAPKHGAMVTEVVVEAVGIIVKDQRQKQEEERRLTLKLQRRKR